MNSCQSPRSRARSEGFAQFVPLFREEQKFRPNFGKVQFLRRCHADAQRAIYPRMKRNKVCSFALFISRLRRSPFPNNIVNCCQQRFLLPFIFFHSLPISFSICLRFPKNEEDRGRVTHEAIQTLRAQFKLCVRAKRLLRHECERRRASSFYALRLKFRVNFRKSARKGVVQHARNTFLRYLYTCLSRDQG
jgi:hypothetical protein